MHIESLRNFYNVATLKSISKVASRTHITQSALSQQLLKLENELDIPLLERSNKGVELTKEGELLLKHFKTIIGAYDRIIEDISAIKNDKNNFIISSSSSSIDSTVLKIIIKLKEKYSNCSFKINTLDYNNVELELSNNLSDVALTYDSIEKESITSLKIGRSELVFVSNPKLNLTGTATIEDLFKYNFILLSDGPDIKTTLNNALISKGYTIHDLNTVFTANSIDIAKHAVFESETISLLPIYCVEGPISTGGINRFTIPEFSFFYDIFLSYNNENYKQSKLLLDDFKKVAKQILR